jgi:hypothetical protein
MIRKPYQNKGALGKIEETEEPVKGVNSGYSFKPEMGKMENS